MSRRTIDEVKIRLDGTSERWTCEVLALVSGSRATLRYVLDRERTIRGTDLVLVPGTMTIAHYRMGRPFNVYHWIVGSRTVAYYANVSEMTEISDDRVAYLDLAVDVLVRPAGALEVLDEDEVPADLDPRHRKTIADALEQLVTAPRALIAEVERDSRPYLSGSADEITRPAGQ